MDANVVIVTKMLFYNPTTKSNTGHMFGVDAL